MADDASVECGIVWERHDAASPRSAGTAATRPGRVCRVSSLVMALPFVGVKRAIKLMSTDVPPTSSQGIQKLYVCPMMFLLWCSENWSGKKTYFRSGFSFLAVLDAVRPFSRQA